ncbi:TlpA disulfide reductase family protein [soil metagenome]
MKQKVFLFVVVAILFLAIGAYFGNKRLQNAAVESESGRKLFALNLPDDKGKTQQLEQWKGKNLVINFWATWCAPCVEEMPELSAMQAELSGRNIQILGIGIDSAKNIGEFTAKYRIAYPIYVAGMEGTELSRSLGNVAGGLPFTVLLSADGRIKKTYLGRLKMDALRADIVAL